jgi:hypothetical protein
MQYVLSLFHPPWISTDLRGAESFLFEVVADSEKALTWIVDLLLSTTKLSKFSGTLKAGVHQDIYGMTCDALAHYSLAATEGKLVLVDIQGTFTAFVRSCI